VYCPGLDAERSTALSQQPHLHVASAPLDLSVVFAEADAAVTNGSFSSSTGFLRAGKPVLVLPTQLEQFLFGWRVEQNQIGLVVTGDRPPTDLLSRLYRVTNDPAIRQNVEAFAARYRDFDQQHVVGNIVQRIGALAGDAR
jgi:UDP:flavonoid glycosyltransferase YjiC (YdhE family)